jgi:hypothetical protein
MRKLGFALTLAVGFSLFGARVSSAQVGVDLGLKAGVNFASISTDDFATFDPEFGLVTGDFDDSRTGLALGGFATFSFGKYFFVQPELFYSQMGGRGELRAQTLVLDWGFNFDYLSIPLLLGVAFPLENSSLEPRVFVGPEVNFEVNCSGFVEALGRKEGGDCDNIGKKTTDFGMVFGAGLGFGFAAVDLILDGRYYIGLTNLEEETGQINNRAWQFAAGIAFPLTD